MKCDCRRLSCSEKVAGAQKSCIRRPWNAWNVLDNLVQMLIVVNFMFHKINSNLGFLLYKEQIHGTDLSLNFWTTGSLNEEGRKTELGLEPHRKGNYLNITEEQFSKSC